ncbi:MAG: MoaD/ThiS family protein [Deltaproteobacteria bacterium]|nr:MoaD/ThiS family protein [Deltaproteobacteria bacterium]
MIQVKVHTILNLKKILGRGDIDLTMKEGSTVKDVLMTMVETYGDSLTDQLFDSEGGLLPYIRLMVNGRDIVFLEKKMETALQEGDEVLILPPVGGG